MGIKDLLSNEFNLTSAVLHWREPWLFRIRLRGDLWIRLLIILGVWIASVGILLLLFSFNNNPPGVALAVGLGLIGAGAAYILVLGRMQHVSGNCRLYKERLVWGSTSAGLSGIRLNELQLDYDEIDVCALATSKTTGQSFSLLFVKAGGDEWLLGIPAKISLKEVFEVFREGGVDVATAKRVPQRFCKGLSVASGMSAAIGGLVLFAAGFLLYGRGNPDAPDNMSAASPIPRILPQPTSGGDDISTDSAENFVPGHASASGVDTPSIPTQPRPPLPGFNGSDVLLPGMSPIPQQVESGDGISTALPGRDSELLGGTGGVPFRKVSRESRPVLGLQFSLGTWSGKQRVAQLEPLFDVVANDVPSALIARPGFAIGAIEVDATDLVNAVRPIFMKIRDNETLDTADTYRGDWIGVPEEGNVKTIGGEGTIVIGIQGRGAAVVDSVGLVFRDDLANDAAP